MQSGGGVAIVDPGPTTCLRHARAAACSEHGVRWDDVRHILLTHIHLDHAGATGTIVRAHPHITVFVHERGAPHMVDPQKLLDSATRLYGDEMDRLWGEFAPVPRRTLVALAGGERVEAGGRRFDVAYTPGTRRITSATSIARAAWPSSATPPVSASTAATSCRRRRRPTSTSRRGGQASTGSRRGRRTRCS